MKPKPPHLFDSEDNKNALLMFLGMKLKYSTNEKKVRSH